MNVQDFKEDLSISYLRAIAAQAKVTLEVNRRDGDSKDVDLRKQTVTDTGEPFVAEFSVQLKATSSKSIYSETSNSIKYQLPAKNFNDLCRRGTNIIILCLLILPENELEWVNQSPDELVLKRCMYWLSLQGESETTNSATVTVDIPKTNIMSADKLNDMIHTIANGGRI